MGRSRLATILLPIVLVVAACGTAGPTASPTSTPTATPLPATPTPVPTAAVDANATELIAAAAATIGEGTVRVDQSLVFEGSSVIADGTTLTGVGQSSLGKPRQVRLAADFAAIGMGEIELIVDDNLVYARGGAFEELAGVDKWLRVDLRSTDPAAAPFKGLASGQNDVSMALLYLYGTRGAVAAGDGVPIRGQATRHYELEVDLEAAREMIPADHAEALEDVIASLRVGGIEREMDAEAWVGADDGLVHRVRYAYRLGPVQGGGEMVTVIDFSDFGAPLDLGVPAPDLVVDVEDAVPRP